MPFRTLPNRYGKTYKDRKLEYMKRWQKIAGMILFALIAIYEFLTWANAYIHLKYVVEPTENDFLVDESYMCVNTLSLGMWLNLGIAVFLFICLWRKGGGR